jgi:hypothetical protein
MRDANNEMISDPKSEVVKNMVRPDGFWSTRSLDPVMVVAALSSCVLIATCGSWMVGDTCLGSR